MCSQWNVKPRLSEIYGIRSKSNQACLLLQFDQLSLIQGVLHCRYIFGWRWNSTVSFASLNFAIQCFSHSMMTMDIKEFNVWLSFLRSKVYWPLNVHWHWPLDCSMWTVSHIAKGDYTEPKTQQGTLTANQPLELLCIDFTKADPFEKWKREYSYSHWCFFKIQPSFCYQQSESYCCC